MYVLIQKINNKNIKIENISENLLEIISLVNNTDILIEHVLLMLKYEYFSLIILL